MLRPLVHLLVASRVTYPFLSELLKELFVEVADRDFALDRKAQTISRLTLLTGIHRKDVKRLREAPNEEASVPRAVSLGAQLVARWMGAAEFLDDAGQPLPLPRLGGRVPGPSFEGLVESVSKDIRARVVLDEWLRLGIARIDDEDRVQLCTEAFVPARGYEEKAFYLGRNLRDHIAAAARNLGGEQVPLLERAVYYDELSSESVDELNAMSRELAVETLGTVNRAALRLQERDARDARDRSRRMSFGVYFYEDADEEPPRHDD